MSEQKNKRNRYRAIDQQTRQQLIKKICHDGENIKDVSQQFGLNISTCKAIVKVYQQEGRIGKKKKRNKIVNVIQTYSFYSMDGSKLQQIGPIKIEESKVSVNKDQSLEKTLQQQSNQKAQKLLAQTIQTKKKVDEALYQQQLIQTANVLQNILAMYPHMQYF